jgi:hypothetical protein
MFRDDKELLRQFVTEAIEEAGKKRIGASTEYMKKEAVREKLQALVQEAIDSGEITGPSELAEWWATVDMASRALKSVPIEAWQTMSKKR